MVRSGGKRWPVARRNGLRNGLRNGRTEKTLATVGAGAARKDGQENDLQNGLRKRHRR